MNSHLLPNALSSPSATCDYTPQLRQFMQHAGVSSFAALSRMAGVSESQVRWLRRGKVTQMRLETLLKLAEALQISLGELLAVFAGIEAKTETSVEIREEFDRLQAQLANQREELLREFQQESLDILESWMLNWPVAAYRAVQNPELAAVKLLPLVKPVEKLIQHWGVEAIAQVGTSVPYDPQQHQLCQGNAAPGQPVTVTHTGYRQGDRLLLRAKVTAPQ
ncbi:MAG TPA: helix-turn-helix domain-containing protein [Oscillatoriales cyanobacterium M59_W2019_021]|nr:helix-turn-helix domain-containing protein [Oscillatoriales cyanobacterium M4454_W2019_049]HIK51622.1 helix-turn-helix domain-containing protein [Oscillatoriales cyanobacterium M59_W2019_021]